MFRIGAINDELSPDLVRGLDLACELGVKDIEIHAVGEQSIEEIDDRTVEELQQLLAERGLRVCNVSSTAFLRCHLKDSPEVIQWKGSFRTTFGSYKDHLRYLQRALDIARTLDAPMVRVFAFWREGPTTDQVYDLAAERLQPAVDLAEKAGIPLVVENCPHTYFDWGSRAVQLVEMVNSPWLKLLWDPCTGVRSGEEDILSAYPRIIRQVAHVHAKDLRFEPENGRPHRYVPIGEGVVPWEQILSLLAKDGYEGAVVLETHHLAPDGTKETAARAMHAGLSRIAQRISVEAKGQKP